MSELLEQLRKAVGESHVLVGEAVHADYTHDEALTATPVVPLAVVLPGLDRRGGRGPAAGQRAPGAGRRPGQRHRALGRRRARWPTASWSPSTAWTGSSRSTPRTTSPWSSPA